MSDHAIREAIQKMAGTKLKNEVYVSVATVVSVNVPARTCIVTTVSSDAEITIEDVLLMASVDDGWLIIPSIDSTVMISYATFTPAYITMFSEIDKVVLVAGSASIELAEGNITFNSGEFGGLVKIQQLVQKLNNLENLVNELITKYNLHTHAGVTTGSGISGITAMVETETLTPTVVSDLENSTVTHGN